jgi:N-acetylglutamate synthase-like GNAT family acetyltransferase
MSLDWIHESHPRWDGPKQEIVGDAAPGVFDVPCTGPGSAVAGDWWRVEGDGGVVGYGWMDCTWEGAEILLAVSRTHRGQGVGTFILDHLEAEAARHGLEYLFNTVRPTHPQRAEVVAWLERRGFTATDDGELRRRVKRRLSA